MGREAPRAVRQRKALTLSFSLLSPVSGATWGDMGFAAREPRAYLAGHGSEEPAGSTMARMTLKGKPHKEVR